ncbi:MAG: tetratricopeptide repeat protein [Bdellovibrionia bacterium]
MPKLEASAIEHYQTLLQKDPDSHVFAPLAEAYRELKMFKEAEKVALTGIKKHPNLVSGLVVLAKIYRDLQRPEESLKLLKRVVSLAPDNLLAHHMMGEIYLHLKDAKEALKSYKMVLFFNPKSQTALNAIKKLESLTADEYDDEVFAMSKISAAFNEEAPAPVNMATEPTPASSKDRPTLERGLERMLSLIDAFIVRNDLERAQELVADCQKQFGSHPELARRIKSLSLRTSQLTDYEEEAPEELIPLSPRQEDLKKERLEALNLMLRNIESYRNHY